MHALSALITPFKPNLEVDEEVYAYLIERQIWLGMDACVPVGITANQLHSRIKNTCVVLKLRLMCASL